jgi:hypothetical protein
MHQGCGHQVNVGELTPDPSLHLTYYGWLRQLTHAGELDRQAHNEADTGGSWL